MEPRESCPFLKLESLYSVPIHIPAGGPLHSGTHGAWEDLKICGILYIAAKSNYNHGFTVLRNAQGTYTAAGCVV